MRPNPSFAPQEPQRNRTARQGQVGVVSSLDAAANAHAASFGGYISTRLHYRTDPKVCWLPEAFRRSTLPPSAVVLWADSFPALFLGLNATLSSPSIAARNIIPASSTC